MYAGDVRVPEPGELLEALQPRTSRPRRPRQGEVRPTAREPTATDAPQTVPRRNLSQRRDPQPGQPAVRRQPPHQRQHQVSCHHEVSSQSVIRNVNVITV